MKDKMVFCGVLMFSSLIGGCIGFGLDGTVENKPVGMTSDHAGSVRMH